MTTGLFQRDTLQRRIILDELRKTRSHPTAQEFYDVVRLLIPKISLGTVYRNLELLSEAGIINKIRTQNGESRFDAITEHHCHIRCIECGRVDDVMDMPSDIVCSELENLNGYIVTDYCIEFSGVCPSCNKAKGKSRPEHKEKG